MPEKLDLTGKQFGHLTVLKEVGKNKHGKYLWLCKCDCGKETIVPGNDLKRKKGSISSCGCRKGRHSHGLSKTPIYLVWRAMLQRCENPNNKDYKDYGGRGIKVYNEWHDVNVFYTWAINNGYQEHLTINRIDNDGNYEPTNCNWVTRKEQANNRRGNVVISYNGETHTQTEWLEILGISKNTYKDRLSRNWSKENAIFTPLNQNRPIDMAGERYGMLTVKSYVGSSEGRSGAAWLCQCDCGEYIVASRRQLLRGDRRTCGNHYKRELS